MLRLINSQKLSFSIDVDKIPISKKLNDYLKKESLIYLETEKNLNIDFLVEKQEVFKEKSFGEKSYRLIKMLF